MGKEVVSTLVRGGANRYELKFGARLAELRYRAEQIRVTLRRVGRKSRFGQTRVELPMLVLE